MNDTSITEDEALDVDADAEESRPRRRGGRRLLVLAGTGLMVIGAIWSFTTIRAGLAAADRDRKGRRRRR
jgi:hypothetical protein